MRSFVLPARALLVPFLLAVTTIAACSGDEFVPVSSGSGGGGTTGIGGASGAGGGAGITSAGGSAGNASAGAAGATSAGSAGALSGGSAGAISGGSAGSSSGTGGSAGAAGASNGGSGGATGDTCANDDACQALAGPCRKGTCGAGKCTFTNDDTRLAPSPPNDCRKSTCVNGTPSTAIDPSDPPDVDAPCSEGICNQDGTGGTKPRNEGGLCEGNRVCNKGFCVACSGQSECPTYPATDCRISTGCTNGLCGVKRNPNGAPDDQPGDCITKVCLEDGSVGESFAKQGSVCTDGGTFVGVCDAKGACVKPGPPQ